MSDFVHLHTHSDFSLLDGAASIDRLVQQCQRFGMRSLALTDHGNMFGALRFYQECSKRDLKPIVGQEVYMAPSSRLIKSGAEQSVRYFHLVLLAADAQGYHNLMKLSSLAYQEGFYYKPRVDDELLSQFAGGLIALSGCLAGEIPSLLQEGQEQKAQEKALFYQQMFGRESFYLELQDHGIPEQRRVNAALARISKTTGIPLVASNDVHYVERDDARAQDILMCIGTNKKVAEGKRLKFEYPEFYLKSQAEMRQVFAELPDSLDNSLVIAERCALQMPAPGPQLPNFDVPQGFTKEGYLSEIARTALEERFDTVTEDVRSRLEYELSVINSMGYSGYFLIVWDFIRFARERGIPVGPGRGSGAGSLVAYVLRITDIDPLAYGLLFERFLNPERVSMPDFDIDFCYERRQEVIDYVTQKYGQQRVGQIITFGTLKARAVIRDVARVLDLPYAEADRIAKLVPLGANMSLSKALSLEPKLEETRQKGSMYSELIETSLRLEGLNRHASTHAAGVVIGREELPNYVPLYRDPKTGSLSTQYTWEQLEDCGLVKMDILGLKTLTLIENTLELIRRGGKEIDGDRIPDRDLATFELLSDGDSACIFQFESNGMQAVLRRAKPDRIEDLIALTSLYRPGPMEYIDQFIDSKLGKRKIVYPLPELEPLLKETYGVIVYQEQVMEIARKIAGFSLGQADILRRAMGKKKPEEMKKQKTLFVEGACKNGYSARDAERVFDILIPFAGYGFNKSHAAAYAVLAYRTAYLKANYPAEFMAANLTNEIHDTDKLSEYIRKTREMGIQILPPDINISERDFAVREGEIVYGLRGIKNVGSSAVDEILSERAGGGQYSDFVRFAERVDSKTVGRKVMEALIQSGVFDSMPSNRATLIANLETVLSRATKKREAEKYGQTSLFDSLQPEEMPQLALEQSQEWPKRELLLLEKQNLGFFFSGHPLDDYRELIDAQATLDLSQAAEAANNRKYTAIGVLADVKVITTKTNRRMAFAKIEDFSGSIELVVFSDLYEKSIELLENETVVAVVGRIQKDRGFPKLVAESVVAPDALQDKRVPSVHIKLAEDFEDEQTLLRLRDYLIERKGRCALYLHMNDVIVRASSHLAVSDGNEVIEGLRSHPPVTEVWKE